MLPAYSKVVTAEKISAWVPRNRDDLRRQAFESKWAPTSKDREKRFDATGKRYSHLDALPGWHSTEGSPVDYMHAVNLSPFTFLGLAYHIRR